MVYACVRCNLYKSDFWIENPDAFQLWNPRIEPFGNYFWQTEDGFLFAVTESGEMTLNILKLNRPQLVAYRRQHFQHIEERRLLYESEHAVQVLLSLNEEQRQTIKSQELRLEEQQRLLEIILHSGDE